MFEKIKLIVSEVDGIITNGKIIYDELCNTPIKEYNILDFEAINKLKSVFTFVFISSHNEVTYNLMRKKNIPFYWAPKNKKQALQKILEKYSVTADEVLYIGCNYSDIKCMNSIPTSVCTRNSPATVQDIASLVLDVTAYSVMAELYELLKVEIIRRQQCL